jgi:hypothetical protein
MIKITKRIALSLATRYCVVILTAVGVPVNSFAADQPPSLAVTRTSPALSNFDRMVTSYDGNIVAVTVQGADLPGLPRIPDWPPQVIVIDRQAGTVELASRTPSGGFQNEVAPSTRGTNFLSISRDGRYTVFASRAINLDPAATRLGIDYTYLYDRATRTVRALNADQPIGRAGGTIDGSGQQVAIYCRGEALGLLEPELGICIRRIADMSLRVVVRLPNLSNVPLNVPVVISANGTHLMFGYGGPSIVPGDPAPLQGTGLYVAEIATGALERVATAADGTPANGDSGFRYFAISADGDMVAFPTVATNLIPGVSTFQSVVMKQRSTGILRRVSSAFSIGVDGIVMSEDGRRLYYVDYAFLGPDLLGRVYDWETNTSRGAAVGLVNPARGVLCGAEPPFVNQIPPMDQSGALSGDGRVIYYALNEMASGSGPCDLFTRRLGPVPAPPVSVPTTGPSWIALLTLMMLIAAATALRRLAR